MKTQLYRHFDKEDNLLYVGISFSSLLRLSQHKSLSSWYDQISRVTIENFENREQALEAETKAILNEKPKKIEAVIVSRNYGDYLELTLKDFQDHF